MMTPMEVATNRLRALRTARGWTTVELARRSHVDRSVISRWERGERQPLVAYAMAVARALGVPLEEILPPPAGDAA
jgi:transcriptional regulator with XRE-family HTH domain